MFFAAKTKKKNPLSQKIIMLSCNFFTDTLGLKSIRICPIFKETYDPNAQTFKDYTSKW